MKRSLTDINGEQLIISQFTLSAECKKGNRPSFIQAMPPSESEPLYQYFLDACKQYVNCVKPGIFGADMKVELLNDGPVTIIYDSDSMCN